MNSAYSGQVNFIVGLRGADMRTIIAGSRTAKGYNDLLRAIDCVSWKPTIVLSGTAKGADLLGERWAKENNVPIERFPADWDRHGKSAGFIRNIEMAKSAEALICLWDGQSKGTKHMINEASKRGLVIYVWRID